MYPPQDGLIVSIYLDGSPANHLKGPPLSQEVSDDAHTQLVRPAWRAHPAQAAERGPEGPGAGRANQGRSGEK